MGLFRHSVRVSRALVGAPARAPVLRCSRVRRRRLCVASRPLPPRRSKRIALQKYRRLTIDTDVKSDDDSDDEDDDSDALDAPDQDMITVRTMTRMELRISKCKCTRTPLDIVTGSAQVWCVCNLPDESTEAEYLGQWCDRDEYWRRFD
jgi:hypothetical protein